MAKRTCGIEENGERCDRDAVCRGMCGKHYQRWRKVQAVDPSSGIPPRPPRHDLIDRTGQRYGRLVVIGRAESRRRPNGKLETYWLCRCDCGSEPVEVRSYELGRERVTASCGCLSTDYKIGPGRLARNQVRKDYKRSARVRGLCWELTEGDFDRLTSSDCFYCGIQPSAVKAVKNSKFIYNGIDRMDNGVGYTPGNAVPCCKTCNRVKKDMPYDEFMTWLARITDFQWFHPEAMPSRLLRAVKKSA